MSNNIIINSEIETLPNELWGQISSFLDPESQRSLSNVNYNFRNITVESARVGAKFELKVFKKFIKEKANASCDLYAKEVDDLKAANQLPPGVISNQLILKYRIEKFALTDAIDHVFEDEREINSLEELKAKGCGLFHFLKASKVAFYITKYFPNIATEMKAKSPCWLSGHNMFHQVAERYALLNALLKEQNEILNNQPINEALLRAINETIYKERLLLIADGYIDAGLDVLPFVNDAVRQEILRFIIVSLRVTGSMSGLNIKKIMDFIRTVQDEDVKIDMLLKFLRLSQSQEVKRLTYDQLIRSASQAQDEYLKENILRELCIFGLLQKERNEVFKIALTIQEEDYKGAVLEALCRSGLSREERDEILKIALMMQDEGQITEVLIALCDFELSREERDEMFKIALTMQNEFLSAVVLRALCGSGLSGEERAKMFKIALEMQNNAKAVILEGLCNSELSREERREIFKIINKMKDPYKTLILAKSFDKFELFGLLQEKRSEILQIAQQMEEEFQVHIFIELYKLASSQEEKIEIFQLVEQMEVQYQSYIFVNLYQLGSSQEEKNEILNSIQEMKNEYRQVDVFAELFRSKSLSPKGARQLLLWAMGRENRHLFFNAI
ncbi:MAG: hypothetical protein V4494_05760 [Chlamydiota bacterium]